MAELNLIAAWVGILLGFASGALIGMGFAREGWLGGYGSWPRRMVRLGHISFFGLAFINLAFAVTSDAAGLGEAGRLAVALLLVGAAAMPSVCFASAWRPGLRRLFVVPVLALFLGTADVLRLLVG